MIIISTGDVNRGGYRLLPEGGDPVAFNKNPILLFHHARSSRWESKENMKLPVGRIENLRLENGQWVADDPIWDEGDDFALTLKRKFDGKFLNAFSPGIIPITVSDDVKYLKQGQRRPTVIQWEFVEISITDIPKDSDAVRLHLSADVDESKILPLLNQSIEMDFKNIAKALNLSADATEEQILGAIGGLNATNVDGVIELGLSKGVITEDTKAHFEAIAKADLASAKALILSMNPDKVEGKKEKEDESPITMAQILKLTQQGKQKNDDVDNKENWDFLTWSQKDPDGLNKMRLEETEKYEKLALAYTG